MKIVFYKDNNRLQYIQQSHIEFTADTNNPAEADAYFSAQLDKAQKEIDSWKDEARAALVGDDVYRGGGVLALAEAMRKYSNIIALSAMFKNWSQ